MGSIGIRCEPERYIYVVLSGSVAAPKVVEHKAIRPPAGLTRPRMLVWIRSDITELLNRVLPSVGLVKTVEGNAMTKDPKRAHVEGVVLEAMAAHPSNIAVETVVKTQIKSRTGFSSSARYLGSLLQTDSLSSVDTPTFREAALAALAGLPK